MGYRAIPLINSKKFAIIDDEDYPIISRYEWYVRCCPSGLMHAMTRIDGKTVYMHSLITGYKHTDHKNNNGLDNRKENLRESGHSKNQMNCGKRDGNYSSQYKGVSWWKVGKKWKARIMINGREKHLGYFSNEIAAAKAYNEGAIRYFKDFAKLNEIEETPLQ